MAKQVQIDLGLFLWIYDYISQRTDTESNMIRQEMNKKLDKILAHGLYTKYKRSPTGAEKVEAKQEYLEHARKGKI